MAKQAASRPAARPMIAMKEQLVKPVRLDLKPVDHARLERIATAKGLTMASYTPMILLERLNAGDSGSK